MSIEFRGKTYASKAALARAYRVHPVTLQRRLDAGASLEEAVRPPMPLSQRGRMAARLAECQVVVIPRGE